MGCPNWGARRGRLGLAGQSRSMARAAAAFLAGHLLLLLLLLLFSQLFARVSLGRVVFGFALVQLRSDIKPPARIQSRPAAPLCRPGRCLVRPDTRLRNAPAQVRTKRPNLVSGRPGGRARPAALSPQQELLWLALVQFSALSPGCCTTTTTTTRPVIIATLLANYIPRIW